MKLCIAQAPKVLQEQLAYLTENNLQRGNICFALHNSPGNI